MIYTKIYILQNYYITFQCLFNFSAFLFSVTLHLFLSRFLFLSASSAVYGQFVPFFLPNFHLLREQGPESLEGQKLDIIRCKCTTAKDNSNNREWQLSYTKSPCRHLGLLYSYIRALYKIPHKGKPGVYITCLFCPK